MALIVVARRFAALAGLLFIRLSRSTDDATDYFQIPTKRMVEVGMQIAI